MNFEDFKDDTEILILCGGKGTRLKSIIKDIPKPMAPLANNKPFLEHLVIWMKSYNFNNFCLLTGHKAEVIHEYFEDYPNINIRYSHENTPLGTAGAIRQALTSSPYKQFIILNGDSILTADINKSFKQFFNRPEKLPTLLLKRMFNFSRYGAVTLDEQNIVQSFDEKTFKKEGLINSGIYFFSKDILNYLDEKDFSLESETFVKLAKSKKLRGFEADGDFIDIGIPDDYESGKTLIPKWLDL